MQKLLTGLGHYPFFVESSILDVRLGSEYNSADSNLLLSFSKNEAADLFANAPSGTFLK